MTLNDRRDLRFSTNKSRYLRKSARAKDTLNSLIGSHTRFRLAPTAMTLDDIEHQNSGFIDFLRFRAATQATF